MAIWKATEISLQKDKGEVVIRTDSKWAVHDTERELPNREITSKILNNVRSGNGRFKIEYVASHSGNRGNDLADKLAKKAASPDRDDNLNLLEVGNIISISEFNKRAEEFVQKRWESKYSISDEWRPNKAIWEKLKTKTKIRVKRIIELITGHGNFRDMLRKKQQSTLSVCRICKLHEESGKHLMNDCIGTSEERNRARNDTIEDRIDLSEELLERTDINMILKGVDTLGIPTAQNENIDIDVD